MVTWLPACVVASECCKFTLSPLNFIGERIIRPLRSFGNKITVRFTALVTRIAIGLRYVWILLWGTVAIICCVVVFHYPGLQLPDCIDFQLFDNMHPFEQYDLKYSQRFWFERYEMVRIFFTCISFCNYVIHVCIRCHEHCLNLDTCDTCVYM